MMNDKYNELREHTLDDIKQVIDFYRLEITDDQEVHDTIEGSLAETIAEWAPGDFEQIEITSTSIGDDLIISVCYTEMTENIDDQFMVVHNERDMFDNSSNQLNEILNSILTSSLNTQRPSFLDFDWTYNNTSDSYFSTEYANAVIDDNFLTISEPIEKLSFTLNELLDGFDETTEEDETEDNIVRSKPLF